MKAWLGSILSIPPNVVSAALVNIVTHLLIITYVRLARLFWEWPLGGADWRGSTATRAQGRHSPHETSGGMMLKHWSFEWGYGKG